MTGYSELKCAPNGMVRLVNVIKSTSPSKKYTAIFDSGKRVHFGGKGCLDFMIYWKKYGRDVACAKRAAYIARHRVNESWLDPVAPGTLSRILLWQFKTLEEGVRRYNDVVAAWRKAPSKRYAP